MLPFLDRKRVTTVLMGKREPDGHIDTREEHEHDDGLMSCMEEFLSAHKAQDAKAMAEAFRNAFSICESQPHEEGSSEDGQI